MFEQFVNDLTSRYDAGEARSIARIVFEDAFGTRRPAEARLSAEDVLRLETIRQRLLAGEPVQYVLGQADFFGLKFAVNTAVLIPRQETEELVAWVLDALKTLEKPAPTVLDIGLGSGCIAVTLKRKRPGILLFGIEKSPAALALAEQNARVLLGEQPFAFAQADILDATTLPAFPLLDVIVSNPPYITRHEQHLMPEHVLAHEPALALFVDNDDPLQFYRAIGRFAQQQLAPNGTVFLECNEFHAAEVADLLRELGFACVELRKDLSGANRMVMGR